MNDTLSKKYDDIDLYNFLEKLWKEKWVIVCFIIVFVSFGGIFTFFKTPSHESKMIYTVETLPPFYPSEKAISDFNRMFYEKTNFDKWKNENNDSLLTFDNITKTVNINGVLLSKDENEMLAHLQQKQDKTRIIIKSKNIMLLNNIFDYAYYTNKKLNNEYVLRSKEELKIIEARFINFSTANDALVSKILGIDRFIVAINKGANVINFERPTLPAKTSPKSFLIILLSAILGCIISIFYIFIPEAIRNYKKVQ